MRCLIILPSLKRAGAETQAVDLANGLSRLGHSVRLCAFESELDQVDRLDGAVQFRHIPRRSKYDFSLPPRVAALIDSERIEIILGVMQFAALIGLLASRRSRLRPPVVPALHTTVNRGTKEEAQDRLVYRSLLKRAPSVVFVCQYQRDYWTRKFPELEPLARVIHNGVDIARFARGDFLAAAGALRQELDIAASSFAFGCIAGFRKEKAHRQLVQAFEQLPANAYLLLAGDGPERPAVEAVVRDRGLARRVKFLGAVKDARPAILASNATVLPSVAVETFSMAMLESMALGVPVIASRIGGVSEAIEHGRSGLLFPPGDTDALVAALRYVMEHRSCAESFGNAAHASIAQHFTLRRMVEGYASLFEEILAISLGSGGSKRNG